MIEIIKRERLILLLREIYNVLIEFGDILKGILRLVILCVLNNNMLFGIKYLWKKISIVVEERFIVENMVYI